MFFRDQYLLFFLINRNFNFHIYFKIYMGYIYIYKWDVLIKDRIIIFRIDSIISCYSF